MGAGWAKPTPSLWAEPKKSFAAVCLELRAGQGRARRRGPADQHRACRAAQPDPAKSGGRLRDLAHHRRGLSDDHAGREGALASPHAERAASDRRRRARRLHHRQRREAFDDAGRRGADAELVLARPRQRQPRLRLLARRAGRAAGATARADVLRAASRTISRKRAWWRTPRRCISPGPRPSGGWRKPPRARTGSRPRSRSAIMAAKNPRSTPWRWR